MSKVLDKTITIGLLVMVVFTALAFGTVEPWSIAIFELGVTVLLLLWAVKSVLDKRLKVNVPAMALPFMLFVALGLIECISFTASDGSRSALSMDVDATRSTVIVLIILLASFIIAANFFASRERLGTLASFLIIFGVALSLFALLQYFTSEGRIYGFKPMRSNEGFGPFVNRNHFAGYMEMLIPVPISLIVARAVHKQSWVFYGFASAIMGAGRRRLSVSRRDAQPDGRVGFYSRRQFAVAQEQGKKEFRPWPRRLRSLKRIGAVGRRRRHYLRRRRMDRRRRRHTPDR